MTPIETPPLSPRPGLIAGWLYGCAAMVFVMAIIGAITRLTESGLSITDWQAAFDLYRATPEYQHKNLGMTLGEFKTIYFWEWLHRVWGRVIGLVFVGPMLWFWLRGLITPRLGVWLGGILILGAAQGFMGWFMVQSGLVDRPSVSHYRLAAHLSLALVLYGALIVLAQRVRRPPTAAPVAWSFWARMGAVGVTLILAVTIIWGAMVAGLDAGLIYNEFPTMGPGRLMPVEMWHIHPAWMNLFENHAAVQFTHRALAMIAVVAILGFVMMAWGRGARGWVWPALTGVVIVQVMLGIITLLSQVNIYLATAHQAGALVLLGLWVVGLTQVFDRRGVTDPRFR
jgi:heme a synthase